ncbi:VWA domain-containing protein [bacterium]|nr:VWA domain-containing protein [bacterium]
MYEKAKQRGQVASLLEQERPNIFTQSVANIMPGDEILITIKYVENLNYDDGKYEFVFPMVVGPRYIPGQPKSESSGGGWAEDTDKVPDASRITPPVLKPGERSGHDIALSVSLDAGVPIQGIESKSHEVEIKRESDSRGFIKLKESDSIPNKDFILNYHVAGKRPEMAILTHRGDSGGFFMLMIQPQAEFKLDEITPKEMVFVVDCSGSMSGEPIAKAKQAMRRCIKNMNPNDSFQIIRFSESASQFAEKPIPNTRENRERGLSYINGMSGQGGTNMIEGIKAALDFPKDPERIRTILFMTDGYIGNETEILAAIQDKLGNARLFSFGVGSSVNRYLLNRMAEVGRGVVQYVRPDENTEEAVNNFYERISKPYLLDIEVDWKDLEVTDVYPKKIPDLFSAQPVIIHGRYQEAGKATIQLKGKVTGKETVTKIDVRLPGKEESNSVLGTLWARTRIKDLMDQMYHGEKQDLVEEVTNLALEFRLMSKYTSFVAVEERLVAEGEGPPKTVMVPVEMPEGVSYEGVFGGQKSKLLSRPVRSVTTASPGSSLSSIKSVTAAPSSGFRGGEYDRAGNTTDNGEGFTYTWRPPSPNLQQVMITRLKHSLSDYHIYDNILKKLEKALNDNNPDMRFSINVQQSFSPYGHILLIIGEDPQAALAGGRVIDSLKDSFTKEEKTQLKKYVENGGILVVMEATPYGGKGGFSAKIQEEVKKIFGDKWQKLPIYFAEDFIKEFNQSNTYSYFAKVLTAVIGKKIN